jgi:hypothetical protein
MNMNETFYTKDSKVAGEGSLRRASRFQKALAHALGWVCLVVGVIGLFVPLLQGVILIVAGLTLLSVYNVFIHRHLHTHLARHPRIQRRAHQLENKIIAFFGHP